jgi:glutamate/tyrosine decarboxylase-like PLP-dependent enzyme
MNRPKKKRLTYKKYLLILSVKKKLGKPMSLEISRHVAFHLSAFGPDWISPINERLKKYSPLTLIAGTAACFLTIQKLRNLMARKEISDIALLVPAIRRSYEKKMIQFFTAQQKRVLEKQGTFKGEDLRIPQEGIGEKELLQQLQTASEKTERELKGRQFSGTLYTTKGTQPPSSQLSYDLEQIAQQLEFLYVETTRRTSFWNPLHPEFSDGAKMEYQLVQMIAESFGGKSDRIMGMVTSGGTESLMSAALAYRNWGYEEKGLAKGEAVIVAPDTIHAAVLKAALAYDIQLVLVPTDEAGAVDMEKMKEAAACYQKQLVAIFGSAPSYPTGKIDPILDMAQLAKVHGCGFHADCCLGASLVNFLPECNAQFLESPNVTSLSADPHKYGFAPKGVSTLLGTGMPGGKPLLFYLTFAFPAWPGGLYGTIGNPGSRSSTGAIQALLAAKTIGKSGYKKIARSIRDTTVQLGEAIEACQGLRLLGKPDLSVVTFKVASNWNPHPGATYEFVHQMHQRRCGPFLRHRAVCS